MALRPKHERFVAEYLVDLNATQAAIRAGYSPHTANEQASRLLANASIRDAVEVRNRKALASLEVSAERVLQEYARLAFSDMRHFASVSSGGVDLKDSSEWSDDDAAAVAELGETTSKEGGSVRFKLHSKTAALDALAKHLRLLGDTDPADPQQHLHLHFENLTTEELRALASGS